MKPSRDKRIIYWNRIAEEPPLEIHRWYFLVINESKMIKRIRQRLYEQLKPVAEIDIYRDETIKGQDLRVDCFSLQSPVSKIEMSNVYQGRCRRNTELYDRLGLDDLVDRRTSFS